MWSKRFLMQFSDFRSKRHVLLGSIYKAVLLSFDNFELSSRCHTKINVVVVNEQFGGKSVSCGAVFVLAKVDINEFGYLIGIVNLASKRLRKRRSEVKTQN